MTSIIECSQERTIGIRLNAQCAQSMIGLVSHISPGYVVRVAERGDKEVWQHRLFGNHSIVGAVSLNSGRPLLRLLQLDMADPRLEFNGSPGDVLPLLFSWSCEMSQSPVIHRVKSSAVIAAHRTLTAIVTHSSAAG